MTAPAYIAQRQRAKNGQHDICEPGNRRSKEHSRSVCRTHQHSKQQRAEQQCAFPARRFGLHLYPHLIDTSYAVVPRREVWRDCVPPRNPFFAYVGRLHRPTQTKPRSLCYRSAQCAPVYHAARGILLACSAGTTEGLVHFQARFYRYWVWGFAMPPAQHPIPSTCAESALGARASLADFRLAAYHP